MSATATLAVASPPPFSATPSATAAGMLHAALEEGFARSTLVLPVLPEVASQVIPLANDPDTAMFDLVALISRDQALTATVLRFANSPAYGMREEIVSLHQAAMRLGTGVVASIAIVACLEGEAFRVAAHDNYRRRIIAHALLSGGIAHDLGRRLRSNPELVFMCALLHTIGQPVVLRLIADLQRSSRGRIHERDAVRLVETFESAAAANATSAWKLPRHVRITATHYRDPDSAPTFVLETRITALASRLATWILDGEPADEPVVRAFPDWDALAILPDEIDEIIQSGRELRLTGRASL